MKKSFTLIELIIVIVVVSILYTSINFSLSDNSLRLAASQFVSHINYTRHLAIKDNKMQYYPMSNTETELNRTKYWFKQWWQLRITKDGDGNLFYEIFSDVPYVSSTGSGTYNFDTKGNRPTSKWDETFAKDPDGKYLIGHCGVAEYPDCTQVNEKLNLTKYYNIVKIQVEDGTHIYNVSSSNNFRIVFDQYGNGYKDEGQDGDAGDINPYDKDTRPPILNVIKVTFCQDNNCETNISMCLSKKIGNIYYCD